ncbi:MAG: twin-arginine translocation signal domain-containing protein [Rubripirellula sp.]|nr:twin-arginine translocation signal domain-containing protein [Rubripirellula sp.]
MNRISLMTQIFNRRSFLKTSAVATVACPAIMTSKRSTAQNVIGKGDLQFECQHLYPQLPSQYSWQTTHNVAVDPDNNLYVIHEGEASKPDHPSIFVFDSQGQFIRAFGEQFQGGGHGLEIHVEDGTPYLYVAAYQQVKTIAKMTVKGELLWQKYAPMQSGHYASGEASNPQRVWGRNRFLPTNFAFLPNGNFLLADGYGSYYIHRYDADGNWLSCFGGSGQGRGSFNLPHGLWVDTRKGGDPEIVVADRANNTLQIFNLDGDYKKTVSGFGLPANIDTNSDLMLVPELVARVSLLDRDHNTLLTIGDDRERILADKKESNGFTIRADETKWQQGKFVHPHDACFDLEDNIYVAEWVSTGRITKLTRV